MRPEIHPAQGCDLPAVIKLLTACGLPSSDLNEDSLSLFHVARSAEYLAGVVGLEVVGSRGLLRSLAVMPDFRNHGLACRLVSVVESVSCKKNLTELYLLANDAVAMRFFVRLGYASVMRNRVPPELLALPEFAQLCPQSCPCLRKVFNPDSLKENEMNTLDVSTPAQACFECEPASGFVFHAGQRKRSL